MAETKHKYYNELNIFRALVIIWVVIGHSTDYNAFFLSGFLKHYAYSFHMQAFFVLSGMLFSKKVSGIDSVKKAWSTIVGRFQRLMIPYFFYSVVSYLMKFFLEKYAFNQLTDNPVLDVLLGKENPNGGIWFLHTLFVFSVVAVLFCKVPPFIMLVLSLGLKIASLFGAIPYFGLSPLKQIYINSVYFFFGIFIYRYYDRISEALKRLLQQKKPLAGIISAVLAVTTFAVFYLLYKNRLNFIGMWFLMAIVHILVWYILAVCMNTFNVAKRVLMPIGNYGMDIYLIGYYFQTAVRVIFGTILGTPFWFFTLLMFVLGLWLPIPVSKYFVRKFKWTRRILLGDFSKAKD